ncbi:hypothetical protein [Gluconobacter oxydans]|uniref:hypothetical protein n=1 Tax=Gluconobacter oxydans TaxID=442 RepID=UPI0039EBAEEB
MRLRINGGWFVPVDPALSTEKASLFWLYQFLPLIIPLEPAPARLGVRHRTVPWAVFSAARRYLDTEGCHLIWIERGITHRFWLDEEPVAGRQYSAALVPDDMGSVRPGLSCASATPFLVALIPVPIAP